LTWADHLDCDSTGGGRPGDGLLRSWLEQTEESPNLVPPVWLVPILARVAERRAPELEAKERARVHQALSRLSTQVAEPWARAIALECLAEVSMWLETGPGRDARGMDPAAALSQARADLALAAGLLQRMGWKRRALGCERRWARLAWPTLGARVAEPGQVQTAATSRPRRSLHWVRHCLLEAGFITGDARVLRELSPLLLLAASPLPVLILGESGTGKEVLARALHRWSQVRGEFVPIHCGAIPRDLLESELFGHTRGAFTGAGTDKPGLVEAADGGSLFLDEIGEMGMEAQMKMLRVLESGEVRRLGDLRPRRARVRLVAATHRDLDQAIRSGDFRLDLYHRIRGVIVRLRPLREHRGDIPQLAAHYLAHVGGEGGPAVLQEESLGLLMRHNWPGNVRELRGVLLRAAHLASALGLNAIPPGLLGLNAPSSGSEACPISPAEELLPETPPVALGEVPSRESVASAGLDTILDELERRLILNALEDSGWNRAQAARALGGLSRTTLLSKMKRLGIGEITAEASPAGPESV
jgi:DNA-binding NtrC family response regulator